MTEKFGELIGVDISKSYPQKGLPAKKVLENLMKEGVNPDQLRAIPD